MNSQTNKRPHSTTDVDAQESESVKRPHIEWRNMTKNEKIKISAEYKLDDFEIEPNEPATPEQEENFKSQYVPFFNHLSELAIGRRDLEVTLLDHHEHIFFAWKTHKYQPLGDLISCVFCLVYSVSISIDAQLPVEALEKKKLESKALSSQQTPTNAIHLPNYTRRDPRMGRPLRKHCALAIVRAWKTPYTGHGSKLLLTAILNMTKSDNFKKPYGNFCAIIQGSGTGKSRMVDELARSVLTIPVVLRPRDDSTGYPEGDSVGSNKVLERFAVQMGETAFQVQRRYLLFLLKALDYLRLRAEEGNAITARDWYEYLGTPGANNESRRKFFLYAMDPKPLDGFEDIFELDENMMAKKASKFVAETYEKIQSGDLPVIFYFDEAHNLTEGISAPGKEDPGASRTAYQCLCKAFTYFSKTPTPIFALFLSTSQLSEFSPSARNFWSYRGDRSGAEDNLHAPFVELPFDLCTKGQALVVEGQNSLDEVTSLPFMARFGRPLFRSIIDSHGDDTEAMQLAMSKLSLFIDRTDPVLRDIKFNGTDTHLLPSLAARIDLTFESNRDEAVYLEGLLVASNLRTVYSVPKHRQYLRGGYSSEPFVAEAAARVVFNHVRQAFLDGPNLKSEDMKPWMIEQYKALIPAVILRYFNAGLISKGARGELVARILLTQARDLCILGSLSDKDFTKPDVGFNREILVTDFLRSLISDDYIDKVLDATPQNMQGQPLKEAFKDAYINFSHFVKGGDDYIITDEAFYLMFMRGGVIQGHENLPEIDMGIPVWLPPGKGRGQHPTRWTMTAIFIQIKNRLNKQSIHVDVQNKFSFFSPSSGSDHNSRPYITIVMQLGVESTRRRATSQGTRANTSGVEPPRTPSPEANQQSQPQSSPAQVNVTSNTSSVKTRSQSVVRHPRYEINIVGCSSRVYQPVPKGYYIAYKTILAYKDLLTEHPRTGEEFHTAVLNMKPYYKIGRTSYSGWGYLESSSIGADGPCADEDKEKEDDKEDAELEETIEVNSFEEDDYSMAVDNI